MSSTWPDHGARPPRSEVGKTPEPTALFWCAIVLASALGGVITAFFDVTLDRGLTLATMLTLTVLAAAMVLQMSATRYVRGLYWPVVLLISVFGALAVDNLTDILDASLPTTGITFTALLILTLVLWHGSERTVSIHAIVTGRREAFYWLAVLFTFALGTTANRLGTETLGVGHGAATVGLALLCSATAGIRHLLRRDRAIAFWALLLVTRPLGGSAGALLAQPRSAGGFGWTALGVGIAVLAATGLVVAYPSLSAPRRHRRGPHPAPTMCRLTRH